MGCREDGVLCAAFSMGPRARTLGEANQHQQSGKVRELQLCFSPDHRRRTSAKLQALAYGIHHVNILNHKSYRELFDTDNLFLEDATESGDWFCLLEEDFMTDILLRHVCLRGRSSC